MANKDLRAPVVANGTRFKTAGIRTVSYVDAKGRTYNAKVKGAGTSSGLLLHVRGVGAGTMLVDNVPAQATINDTVCYIART